MSKADTAIMEEKASKLSGAAKMLDFYLEGDFNGLFSPNEIRDLNREEKISLLNKKLTNFTDLVAQCFPLVGVGYYSVELDAIITYGPSQKFHNKVGQSISNDHLGRKVMSKRKEMIVTEEMVRGNCMACFIPLIRKSKVIGYVWATEPIKEIYKQIREIKQKKSVFTDLKMTIDILTLAFLSNKIFFDLAGSKDREIGEILKEILFSSDRINGDIYQFIDQIISSFKTIKTYSENILADIAAALITVDLRGKILFLNKSAHWLFKKEEKEIISGRLSYYSLLGFKELGLKKIIKEVIDTGKTYLATEINYPGGEKNKIVNLGISLLQNINKQKMGVLIIVEDISTEKALEHKKIQEKKLATFGELAVNLVHEISNPLAVIKALVQLLPERINDQNFVSRFIKEIEKEVERIDKIFKNLFSLVRSPDYYFEYTNVDAILNEVLFFIEGMAKARQVKIIKKFEKNLPKTMINVNQISQVFLNLILNAFHAMPEGGILEVCTIYDYKDSYLKIKFKDSGCGIVRDSLDKVFEPFFTTKENGTGIGLAVSYNIIQQHGGFIQAESKEGEGSIFTVVLSVVDI